MLAPLLRLMPAGPLLCAFSANASAQERQTGSGSFDDIVVTAQSPKTDPTQMAPEAASLLRTAGDVNDPLKALLALPGITFGAGDLSQPVVRGAGPADNLYLVDDVPVPNIFHELSDSIVSANAIRSFDLMSAALALPYGGATGGVIDVRLRDPLRSGHRIKVDLSQLKSGAILEAPLTENLSAYASGRVNLAHLFLKNLARGNELLEFRMPQSRDYTVKATWRLGRASISATALGSWDQRREQQRKEAIAPSPVGLKETRRLDAQSLRLLADVGSTGRLIATVAHVHSVTSTEQADGDFQRLRVRALSVRSLLQLPLGPIKLATGVNIETGRARYAVAGDQALCDFLERRCSVGTSAGARQRDLAVDRLEAFGGATWQLDEELTVDAGARLVRDGTLKATEWEPRAAVEWRPGPALAAYARVSRQHQRPELVRLLLAGDTVSQQELISSKQVLAGVRIDLGRGWRTQLEGWTKDFEISDLVGTPLASRVQGTSRGADLLLVRSMAKHLDGWFSLSRTWTTRKLLPGRSSVPYRYDIPWSATVAATWRANARWSLAGKLRMQSGVRFTPLTEVVADASAGALIQYFGEPFSARAPLYARLDLRVERRIQIGGTEARAYIDALNVLDRRNVAERRFPLRNTVASGLGLVGRAEDEDGVPRFAAIGISFDL